MSDTRREFVKDVNRAIGVERTAAPSQTARLLQDIVAATEKVAPEKFLTHDGLRAPLSVTVFADPLAWLKENLSDVCASTDGATAVVATSIKIKGRVRVHALDKETGEKRWLDEDELLRGLHILFRWVLNAAIDKASGRDDHSGERAYLCSWTSPMDMTDACNWDVEGADALLQCAWYGEVI